MSKEQTPDQMILCDNPVVSDSTVTPDIRLGFFIQLNRM